MVLLTACLPLTLSAFMCYSGLIPLVSPAIPVSTRHSPSFCNISDGPPWMLTTQSFISTCSVCAQNKSSTRPSSSLLRPLPVLSPSWSHIALDFITGLPPSEGKMVTLTILDCFFPKLPIFLLCPNSHLLERLLTS